MNSEHDSRSGPARGQDKVVQYKDSGITERHGAIPPWLLAVIAALTAWGIYYLVAFWQPPG